MKKTKWLLIWEEFEDYFGWEWKIYVFDTKEETEEYYADLQQQTYVRNLMRIKRTREWREEERISKRDKEIQWTDEQIARDLGLYKEGKEK